MITFDNRRAESRIIYREIAEEASQIVFRFRPNRRSLDSAEDACQVFVQVLVLLARLDYILEELRGKDEET